MTRIHFLKEEIFLFLGGNCTLKSFHNRVEYINYQSLCLPFRNVEPVTPIGNPSPTLFRKPNMEAAKMAPPGRGSDAFWLRKNTWIFSLHVKFQGIFPVRTVFFFPPGRRLPSKDPPLLPSLGFSLVSWRTPTRLRSYSFRCKRWGVRDILYLSSLSP